MDEEYAVDWMREFVDSIGMKVLMGPYAKFLDVPGNTGLTVAAIIETSHIVMHTWTEVNPALIQFDVYSCGEFDAEDVCKKIAKDFELTKIEYKYLNRETGLMDISGGILNYKK
jgi:S-adenosylmethionine/arginine decarboxylase-like enzyme